MAGIRSIASVALIAGAVLAGCGGSDTTTVINETTTTAATESTSTDSSSTTTATDSTTTSTEASGGTGVVLTLKAFQSPTGNIACVMTGKFARCDISERDWSPPAHPSSCPEQVDFGQGVQLPATGAAALVCAGDTVLNPQAKTLPYGTSSHVGLITCASEESGVSCRNESGGSFTISRQGYDLG